MLSLRLKDYILTNLQSICLLFTDSHHINFLVKALEGSLKKKYILKEVHLYKMHNSIKLDSTSNLVILVVFQLGAHQ